MFELDLSFTTKRILFFRHACPFCCSRLIDARPNQMYHLPQFKPAHDPADSNERSPQLDPTAAPFAIPARPELSVGPAFSFGPSGANTRPQPPPPPASAAPICLGTRIDFAPGPILAGAPALPAAPEPPTGAPEIHRAQAPAAATPAAAARPDPGSEIGSEIEGGWGWEAADGPGCDDPFAVEWSKP